MKRTRAELERTLRSRQRRRPAQRQRSRSGREADMRPQPLVIRDDYRGAGRLAGQAALISGGDSGIGRAIAVHFAREGCDVAIMYRRSDRDARETVRLVEAEGRRCLLLAGDARQAQRCRSAVAATVRRYGRLDVLVNNLADHVEQERLEDITNQQLRATFENNVFPYFMLTRYALEHLKRGAVILNTSSVTAFRGSPHLIDYAATKGAIETFTYSLAKNLAERGIRVNGVAPGPIWTPLVVSSFDAKDVKKFGADTPMKRAGEPCEVAPAFVFLASADASYITGQFIHVNGGGFMG
ncbi:MAG TPA: SDR family oxidoreductase [Xanthomonadales bacterium]|nr:SDR family oxidoreductase [Xanthomonadales bacterium]